PSDPRRAPIPKLSEVLALAKVTGARLNLEIKNIPPDPDFDATSGFANSVIDEIERSAIPHSQLIIQSFWFPNLDLVRSRLPDVETSFLSLGAAGPAYVDGRGDDWLSAQWPAAAATIAQAHA